MCTVVFITKTLAADLKSCKLGARLIFCGLDKFVQYNPQIRLRSGDQVETFLKPFLDIYGMCYGVLVCGLQHCLSSHSPPWCNVYMVTGKTCIFMFLFINLFIYLFNRNLPAGREVRSENVRM